MPTVKAVITADIVNSSLLEEKQFDELLYVLKNELKKQKVKSDFYRGDSFHALCEADMALSLSLRLRLLVKQEDWKAGTEKIDIRLAIGVGTVEEPVKSLSTAKGEAFLLSGRELDKISKTSICHSIRSADKKIDAGFEALSLLIDYLMKNMTSKQAETLAELMTGSTQTEAARKLKKSQSTINKLAQTAQWDKLEKSIQIYRKLVSLIAEQYVASLVS